MGYVKVEMARFRPPKSILQSVQREQYGVLISSI